VIITEELRVRLRRMIDEKIPAGGSAIDTRFSDGDLDVLLEEADCIEQAAASGWLEKAGILQSEISEVQQITTGAETYKLTSLKEKAEYALTMYDRYVAIAQTKSGYVPILLDAEMPEVL
jgi:hypothetical protein